MITTTSAGVGAWAGKVLNEADGGKSLLHQIEVEVVNGGEESRGERDIRWMPIVIECGFPAKAMVKDLN